MQSNVVMGDNLYLKGYWTLYVNSVCIYQKVIFYWWDGDILSIVMETIFFIINMCLVTQSYPTLCNKMDCSPAGSSVPGDSPGKNTGVGYISFSGRSSQPRDWSQVSHTGSRFFTIWVDIIFYLFIKTISHIPKTI